MQDTDDAISAEASAAARPTNRRRQKERTRQAILQSALDSFGEKGFDSTTTRTIAERAGVNHAMIKYYFKNKRSLWDEAVEFMFDRLTQAVDAAGIDEMDLDDLGKWKVFLRRYVRYCAEHPEHARIMVQENMRVGPRLDWTVSNFIRPGHERMQPLTERLVAQGHLPDVERSSLTYMFVGAAQLIFALAPEVERTRDYDPLTEEAIEAHIDAMLKVFLRE